LEFSEKERPLSQESLLNKTGRNERTMTNENGKKQEPQENTIGPVPDVASSQGAVEPDLIPAGADCAGRTETGPGAGSQKGYPRRCTVKGRKRRRNRRAKNPGGRAANGPSAGQHIRPGIVEAAEILIGEKYIVGKVIDPGSPFDLTGYKREGYILLRVVRPKQSIANAAETRKLYEKEIREIEPYWNSDADNIQFWVFSRKTGLFRYQVYNGGIWNVDTMRKSKQKTQAMQPEQQTAQVDDEIRRMRDARCTATLTGVTAAPVQTSAQAGIPSKSLY
jgi:hypothetical protein